MTPLFSTRARASSCCPICGGDMFLELVEPRGMPLCPRCGRLFRRVCAMLEVSEWQMTLSTLLSEDLGLDSLDLVELVTELEKEFGVTIPDEQGGNIRTIGEAVAMLEALAERGETGGIR